MMSSGMKGTVVVCMSLKKLRSCAMELAELENTRSVLTCRSAKENMEGELTLGESGLGGFLCGRR